MKKFLVKVIPLIIGIIAIVYVGYLLNLYPTSVIEQSKEQLGEAAKEIEQEVEKETGTSAKNWLRQIYENLDAGMQSNDSKDEANSADVSEFEASLECFYVETVVDGDTIIVSNDNTVEMKVRYIGIDTPESVHDDKSKNTAEGKVASERNEEIISSYGNEVYLEYDSGKKDEYGRTLAYVYLYDWDTEEYTMVQDILLKEGMCRCMRIEPNTKYSEHFSELEAEAKENKVGFWGTGFYD